MIFPGPTRAACLSACLLACLPLMAQAAQQGKLGENSTASYTISLAIQPSMEINTVSDIALNISDRSIDATFSKPFCVRGNTPNKYTLVASGANQGNNAFVLRNANNAELRYYVSFRGDLKSTTFDNLSPGVPSRIYSVQSRGSICDSSTEFKVTFRSMDLETAGSGLYTGSLTLLVSPV